MDWNRIFKLIIYFGRFGSRLVVQGLYILFNFQVTILFKWKEKHFQTYSLFCPGSKTECKYFVKVLLLFYYTWIPSRLTGKWSGKYCFALAISTCSSNLCVESSPWHVKWWKSGYILLSCLIILLSRPCLLVI